jgi:hypothetical protein
METIEARRVVGDVKAAARELTLNAMNASDYPTVMVVYIRVKRVQTNYICRLELGAAMISVHKGTIIRTA